MGASSGAMQLRYSKHARHVMRERGIPVEWVEQVVASVELRVPCFPLSCKDAIRRSRAETCLNQL